jgi:hypothetical protein
MELLLLLRFAIIVIESLVITALSGTVLLHLQQARCQHLRKAQHKQEKYLRIIYLQRRLQTNPELTSATDATKTADFHTFIRAISAEFRRQPCLQRPDHSEKSVVNLCQIILFPVESSDNFAQHAGRSHVSFCTRQGNNN